MRDVGLSEGRGRELYFWLYIFRRREAVPPYGVRKGFVGPGRSSDRARRA